MRRAVLLGTLLAIAGCSDTSTRPEETVPLRPPYGEQATDPAEIPVSSRGGPGVWRGSPVPAGYRTLDLGGFQGVALNDRMEVAGIYMGDPAIWRLGEIHPLHGLPGDSRTTVHDINDRGQVVGSFLDDDGLRRAFRWEDGEVVDLGTLGEDLEAEAHGISERGDVVGFSYLSGGFIWRAGEMRPLPGTDLGDAGRLWAINDGGDATGSIGDFAAFWGTAWEDPQPITISVSGDSSTGVDVSSEGQMVGLSFLYSEVGSRNLRGWLWEDGALTVLPLLGAETAPNQDVDLSEVAAINDAGVIVGVAADETLELVPVTWSPPDYEPTVIADDGTPWDINDRGVIGLSDIDGSYLLVPGGAGNNGR